MLNNLAILALYIVLGYIATVSQAFCVATPVYNVITFISISIANYIIAIVW